MFDNNLNSSTNLCIDLKTQMRTDKLPIINKEYTGTLMRDGEEHYTFKETMAPTCGKRNKKVYDGRLISVTRRDDGSYRTNFKGVSVTKGFSVEEFAQDVKAEIIESLNCLLSE